MATPTTLPDAFTSGQVLTAAEMNALRGAFRILQVVYGSTTTRVDSSSTTYVDTGLSVSITPTSSSSKVLVLVAQNGLAKFSTNSNNGVQLKLLRDATDIDEFGFRVGWTNTASDNTPSSGSVCVLDSPATTSATTYKTQFANYNASALVSVQLNNMLSTIVAMEVSA